MFFFQKYEKTLLQFLAHSVPSILNNNYNFNKSRENIIYNHLKRQKMENQYFVMYVIYTSKHLK